MIEKNWEKFTAFYFVKNAPATNNPLENYYSTSLKTHRKKQLRTDRGIHDHMNDRKSSIFGAPNNEKSRTTGQTQKNTHRNIHRVHTLHRSRIKKARPTNKNLNNKKKT